MAGICTVSTSPGSCSHRTLTIVLDGESFVIKDVDVSQPLSTEEKEQFIRLGLRRQRAQGVTYASLANRAVIGDEATNVKMYELLGPGTAVTKTNIGSTYVNVAPGLNGERVVVDFTGCTQYRFLLNANLIGTGAFGARCVRDTDNAVLHENANLGAAGEREFDTDWQTLPAAFQGTGLTFLRLQGKSVTALDDPVYRRCQVGLR